MSLETAAIAANRFGLGARPGELKAISGDPRGWLKAQLTPDTTLPPPLARLPSSQDDLSAFGTWGVAFNAGKATQTPGAAALPGQMSSMGGTPLTIEQSYEKTFTPRQTAALAARFDVATTTDKPYFERLVHFWGNHFAVSNKKLSTASQPQAFERDVARKYAVGHFDDMLLASSKHPAMLLFLDNHVSVGPNSQLAANPEKLSNGAMSPRGLNENLAREIMELHTMGVRSGYSQADVTTLAKMITGWDINRTGPRSGLFLAGGVVTPGEDPEHPFFLFYAPAHEPGPQTLMGKVYPQEGVEQGDAALRDIARNPATATFIATKLCRHFVGDDPPAEAVARVAKVFRETDGDLHAVSVALVDEPEAWRPQRTKMKPPEDFLVSSVRAMGGPKLDGAQLYSLLNRMGQLIYDPAGPDGWADVSDNWVGADAIWKRLEWSMAAAKEMGTTSLDPSARAIDVLGGDISPATLQGIQRSESPAQGLALLLVSPEFQRR